MAVKDEKRAKAEPIGGSVNISKASLETAREVAKARGVSIRAVTEGAIRDAFVRKFGAKTYKDKYGQA